MIGTSDWHGELGSELGSRWAQHDLLHNVNWQTKGDAPAHVLRSFLATFSLALLAGLARTWQLDTKAAL